MAKTWEFNPFTGSLDYSINPAANHIWTGTHTHTITSASAFLIEDAGGVDRFLVDTSTPKIDLLAPTNVGVAGTTAYNFDIHQNASGKGIFWRPANTGTNPQLEYIGKDGLTSHIKVSAANTATVSSWVLFDIQPSLSGTVGRGISLPINIALADSRTINASGLGFDAVRLFPMSVARSSGFSSNQSGTHQLAGLYMTFGDAGTYSVSTGGVVYTAYGMTADLGGMSPVFSATSGTNTLTFSLLTATGGGSWGGGNAQTTLAFRLIDLNDTYTQISGFAGAGGGGFHYGIHYRPTFNVISGGAITEAALRADRSGIQLISDGTAGTYSGGNLMMGASLDWDRFYEADNEAVENIPTGAVYDWRINAVDQMSLALRSLTLGDNTANDFSISFNQSNDATLHWDNTDKAFYTETNGASEFIYPTYGAGFVINDRNIVAGTSRFATQFWTTAASPASSTSEVGAFWGGFHDSGSSTPSLAGVYGLVPFNYFAGTNARTYTTIWGLYAGNEFDAVTQITATDIYGAFIDPLATGGSGSIASATNIYGVSINAPTATATGAVTNWYGLRIATSAIATNNYSIFLNTTGVLAFRNANHQISSPSSGVLRFNSNTSYTFNIGSISLGTSASAMTLGTATFTLLDSVGLATYFTITPTALTFVDAQNVVFGTTTGSKMGTSTSQLLSFWNATPIVQPANTVAIDTLLVNTGLRASGGVALFDTDIKAGVVGKGLYVKEGSNATMGTATLVGGTVVVSTTKVTANSRIFLTNNANGGTVGALYVSARTASTSFTITSTSGTDTSTVGWLIMEPA